MALLPGRGYEGFVARPYQMITEVHFTGMGELRISLRRLFDFSTAALSYHESDFGDQAINAVLRVV